MKYIVLSCLLLSVSGSAFAKDKLQCQSKCYKHYRECTKDSQKAANKLEKICKGDQACTEKGSEQTAENNSSCDATLQGCTDACEPKQE